MDQILNGVLTTLVAAITSSQTTGIEVSKLPVNFNLTSGAFVTASLYNSDGSLAESMKFNGSTGSGPFTLTGVIRAIEGTAASYASGTQIGIGDLTANSMLTNFIGTVGGIISAQGVSGSQAALVITDNPAYFVGLPQWAQVPHAGSIQVACDGTSAASYIDTFGTTVQRSTINLRMANGSASSPTGTLAGQEMGRIAGRGAFSDSGVNFAGTMSAVSFICAENTTSTNQGAVVGFRTTPIGSAGGGTNTTPPLIGQFYSSGGFGVFPANAPASDPGPGAAVFTGGIVGSTSNDSAAAGHIGEYVASTLASGSAIALTSGTTANITSISLTAGDWDVTGVVDTLQSSGASNIVFQGGINTTSATIGGQDTFCSFVANETTLASTPFTFAVPTLRFSLATTTTLYLVVKQINSGTGVTAYGTLRARRMR